MGMMGRNREVHLAGAAPGGRVVDDDEFVFLARLLHRRIQIS